MITYFGVRAALLERFGETTAGLVRDEEECEIEAGGSVEAISPYRYMSRVFFDGVLVPAVERGDERTVQACCDFLEAALTSGDRDLWECVTIRVTENIVGRPDLMNAVRAFGGPRLKRELAEQCATLGWPPAAKRPVPGRRTTGGRRSG